MAEPYEIYNEALRLRNEAHKARLRGNKEDAERILAEAAALNAPRYLRLKVDPMQFYDMRAKQQSRCFEYFDKINGPILFDGDADIRDALDDGRAGNHPTSYVPDEEALAFLRAKYAERLAEEKAREALPETGNLPYFAFYV